jgi:hypothetical protein
MELERVVQGVHLPPWLLLSNEVNKCLGKAFDRNENDDK